MTDDARNKSIERARTSGLLLVGTGLNALLPGAGSLALRLGQHVVDLVTATRIARLEDFHRRVFEGELREDEINERFAAMGDGDFQHLLTAMLTDIEAEKVSIYSSVYIHLVEHNEIEPEYKRMWVLAVSQLHVHDFWVLQQIVERRWNEYPSDSEQRLTMTGLVTLVVRHEGSLPPPGGSGSLRDPNQVSLWVQPTEFAKQFLSVIRLAMADLP